MIPVNTPLFIGNEKKYLNDCIDSGWVSSEGQYVKKFEEALSGYYDKKYAVAVTNGSVALDLAVEALELSPGDEVILPSFTIISCLSPILRNNLTPVFVDQDISSWNMDVNLIEKLITPKTKGILICNPGNPTGYLYSKEELETIRNLVKKHDLFLFSDEVYREFCYDGAVPHSTLQLEGVENNVVVIDSVSKRYSMCGARVGALVTKNQEVLDMALKFGQARLSPPTFGQIAGEAALDTPQSYFEDVKEEYVERRNILVNGLNKIPGVVCPKPSGAFYAIAKLPIDNADKFCQWILEEFNHENQTVMLAPATGFYATHGNGTQEVRLAYVLNKDALIKAVECIEKALEQYPGKVSIIQEAVTLN